MYPTYILSALFYWVGRKGRDMVGNMEYAAIKDGVRFVGEMSKRIYYPLCNKCGKETMSLGYRPKFKYICKECYELDKLFRKRERREKRAKEKGNVPVVKSEETLLKIKENNENMMSKALKRINRLADLSLYIQAVAKVEADMESGAMFNSTEEVIVGLELTRRGIKYRQQVRFGSYRADFVLDDFKIVLEVDGKLFHTDERKYREQLRDGLILASLGPRWEMLRISDDLINKKIYGIAESIADVIKARKRTEAYISRNIKV